MLFIKPSNSRANAFQCIFFNFWVSIIYLHHCLLLWYLHHIFAPIEFWCCAGKELEASCLNYNGFFRCTTLLIQWCLRFASNSQLLFKTIFLWNCLKMNFRSRMMIFIVCIEVSKKKEKQKGQACYLMRHMAY